MHVVSSFDLITMPSQNPAIDILACEYARAFGMENDWT